MAGIPTKEIEIGNFSGGINTRDHPAELQDNEFPDSLNVSLDQRGAITKRLGYVTRSTTGSGVVSNLFYWASRGLLVQQSGTGMWVEGAGAAFLTWTTSARCGMCEFAGNLILIHPVDGLRIYNGTSVTSPAGAPKGDACAAWQNRVWTNDSVNTPRVNFSAIGDATSWPVNNWVDIREKDSSRVVALAGASGVDISGRPGLLVFKSDSAYRIYDSVTGAYNTIDPSTGAGSNIATFSIYGRTYAINTRGIFYTDGIDPMQEASGRISNLFSTGQVNISRPDLFSAGRYLDRLYFSVPMGTGTANSMAFEIHPLAGWIIPRTDAMAAYANINQVAIGASPSLAGRLFTMNSTGSDNSVAIASSFQSRWLEPFAGNQTRIRRLRLVGYGAFHADIYKDYEAGASGPGVDASLLSTTYNYNSGVTYDSGALYGPGQFQNIQDFYSINVVRALSLRITETSSLTQLGSDTSWRASQVYGAWKLSHYSVQAISLGPH